MADNKTQLKKAVESKGVEAVKEAIDNAGPQARQEALEALGGTDPNKGSTANKGTVVENVAPGFESDQVGIPGVNVNVGGGKDIETFQQQEDIKNIETGEEATNLVTDTIKEDIASTPDKIADIEATAQKQDEEDKTFRDNQIAATTDYYKDIQNLQDSYTKDLEASEQRTRDILEERLTRDKSQLEEQKSAELELLEREKELQAAKDKQALLDAEKQIEVSRQQSAWAYQKLGLGFSSGIINTSQQIATEGAETIAALKVQANYNQADIAYKAAQIEFEYTSEINGLIDKYTDAQIELEAGVKDRIYNTQRNTLLNEEEKRKEIDSLKREYITNKREREAEIKAETERIRDKAFERTLVLQSQLKAEEEFNRTELQTTIETGNWATLSIEERTRLAKKAGLTLDEVNRLSSGTIGNTAVSYARGVLGDQFMFTPDELSKIKSDANYYAGLGYTLEESTNLATQKIVDTKYKAQLAAAKAAAAANKKPFVPDRGDLFQKADGKTYYINEDTGEVEELIAPEVVYGGGTSTTYPGPINLTIPTDFASTLPRVEYTNVGSIRNVGTQFGENNTDEDYINMLNKFTTELK